MEQTASNLEHLLNSLHSIAIHCQNEHVGIIPELLSEAMDGLGVCINSKCSANPQWIGIYTQLRVAVVTAADIPSQSEWVDAVLSKIQ